MWVKIRRSTKALATVNVTLFSDMPRRSGDGAKGARSGLTRRLGRCAAKGRFIPMAQFRWASVSQTSIFSAILVAPSR
jgi:hypothetical protein